MISEYYLNMSTKFTSFNSKNNAGITLLWKVYVLLILIDDLRVDAFGVKSAMSATYYEIQPLKTLN